jgi:hypothetical protein
VGASAVQPRSRTVGGLGADNVNGVPDAGDLVVTVDGNSFDSAAGGAGANDTCIIDVSVNGAPGDGFNPDCETVLETTLREP